MGNFKSIMYSSLVARSLEIKQDNATRNGWKTRVYLLMKFEDRYRDYCKGFWKSYVLSHNLHIILFWKISTTRS